MQLIVMIGIVFAIVGVAFALQNNVPVTVTFLVWRFDSSLAMVLLLALGMGALIVALVSTPSTLKAKWSAARLRRQIDALESEKRSQAGRIAELEAQRAAAPGIVGNSNAAAAPIMPTFPMTDKRPAGKD